MKKGILSVTILVLLFVCTLMVFTACTPSHGMPNGTYHSSDKDGNLSRQGLEYAWQIEDNESEYLYITYEILVENDKIYFCQRDSKNLLYKYEVEYNKKTKILTIYNLDNDDNKTALLYKR